MNNLPSQPYPDNAKETFDAFHRGAFYLIQPARKGHRAGIDAMILASVVPDGFSGSLADLGAGAGAAGLAVAARCPASRVTLVERSDFMMDFACRTLNHPLNATVASRTTFIKADVTLAGKMRTAVGLADNSFDFVIMNPPFNTRFDRQTPDNLKAEAHIMQDGMFEKWIRTAAAIVKPGGAMAVIARPISFLELLAALSGRFGGLTIVPIQPRQNTAAIRIVIRGMRASRAKLTFAPALILHDNIGHAFTERANAINNGQRELLDRAVLCNLDA